MSICASQRVDKIRISKGRSANLKTTVMHRVGELAFYVDSDIRRRWESDLEYEMVYRVRSYPKNIRWEICFESNDIDRTFNLNDYFQLEGTSYEIIQIINLPNGDITYHIAKNVYSEIEGSRLEAETEMNNLKNVAKEKVNKEPKKKSFWERLFK